MQNFYVNKASSAVKKQLHTFGLAQENTQKLLILQLQQQQTNYISYTDSLCWIVSYTPKNTGFKQ